MFTGGLIYIPARAFPLLSISSNPFGCSWGSRFDGVSELRPKESSSRELVHKKTAPVFTEAVKKGPYPGGSFPNPCLQGGRPKVKVEYTSTILSALYYFV
jgi:hypothetical protein